MTIKFVDENVKKSATFKIAFLMNMLVGCTQTFFQSYLPSNYIKDLKFYLASQIAKSLYLQLVPMKLCCCAWLLR